MRASVNCDHGIGARSQPKKRRKSWRWPRCRSIVASARPHSCRRCSPYAEAPLLDTPDRVADLLREENRLYTVETLQVAYLNTRRRLIAVQNLCQGTLDTLLVLPLVVFSGAISKRAAALILIHNHPSGVIPHPVLCRMA